MSGSRTAAWVSDFTLATAYPSVTARTQPCPSLSPARAYWNQRLTVAAERERILALGQAVDRHSDLLPYQWAQLMAAAMEFAPELILELGRHKGNSTCAFVEASHRIQDRPRVLSLCLSDNWTRETVTQPRKIMPQSWFQPLEALRTDILDFPFEKTLLAVKRVLIFWDAHGFDVAECVLGRILAIVVPLEHLVIMHDITDNRYASADHLEYGEHGLWKGTDWSGPRVKLGIVDSAVGQCIATLDFAARNRITLDSADHSYRTELSAAQQEEMRLLLGDLFDTQAHWIYFTLNQRPGPFTYPRHARPRASAWRSRFRFWLR